MDIFVLILAGGFEVGIVYCLNRLNSMYGLRKIIWYMLTCLSGVASIFCFSTSMVTLEVGVAYTIWAGIGSIGSLLLGILVFGDKLNKRQIFSVIIITISIIGLKSF